MIQAYNYNHNMDADEVMNLFIGAYNYHLIADTDIDEMIGHTTLERFYGRNDKWKAIVIIEPNGDYTIKRHSN